MTKFVKMSLAAAVAVAGFSSTASASSLEEAIKGVDISGMMRYRYEHKENNTVADTSTTANVYDLDVTVTTPVNDMLSATVTGIVDATTSASTGDANPSFNAEEAYFTLNTSAATVMAGKQGVPGPFDDGQTGSGLVALVPAGPVTIAAGHFENHSVGGTTTLDSITGNKGGNGQASAAAVIGAMGDIKADVWYFNAHDLWTGTSLHVSAPVGPVSIDVRHSIGETDSKYQTTDNEATLTQATVSGKFGKVGVKAAVVSTGKHNGQDVAGSGLTNRVAIDADNDAAVDLQYWNISTAKLNEATGFLADVSFDVADKVKLSGGFFSVGYGSTTYGNNDADKTETKVQVDYKMSKNFNLMARYGAWDEKSGGTTSTTVEYTRSRIEAKYTF